MEPRGVAPTASRFDLAYECRVRSCFRGIDVCDDPDFVAFAQTVAHGNETVPTVCFGDVSMFNPSARWVHEHVIAVFDAGTSDSR